MKTPKLLKGIAKKFKNRKGSKETEIQEPSISSSTTREEGKKLSEEILSVKMTTEQQTPPIAKTTIAEDENSEQGLNTTTQDATSIIGNIEADAYENSNESSLIEHKPCENSNESNTMAIEHIAASIEKLDNTGICEKNETAVTETDIQEPNASNSPSSAACFDNGSSKENTADKKEKPSMQQRRAILAGSVGAALLVSSVVAYILKMYAIAVIGGIVGLACISFALYDALKPSTQLEKVENVEQLDVKSLPSL